MSSPERDLAIAVLQIAWGDLRSPYRWQREAALRFFREAEALDLWCALVGIETALVRSAAQVQAHPGRVAPVSQQLALFAEEVFAHG